MPPVRALSADPELFTETFSLASLVACGKSLLGGTPARVAAAALVVYAALIVSAPGAHRIDSAPAGSVVAAPVVFVPKRAPVVPTRRQPSSKPAVLARPAPQPSSPAVASTPAPVRPAPAPAHRPARTAPPAPRVSHPPVSSSVPTAPPAAPTAPDPPPAEAPALPVVPPLPPLPPVTDPQQPGVDRPSLPLGP